MSILLPERPASPAQTDDDAISTWCCDDLSCDYCQGPETD